MRPWPLLPLLLSVLGCSEALPDGVVRIESPNLSLPAGEEVFWCYFGTFEEDMAVTEITLTPNTRWMHHLLLKEVPEDEPHQDGDLVDCLELGDWWGVASTIFESVGDGNKDETDEADRPEEDPSAPRSWARLPEGLAFRAHAGQRWVLDAHFVNTSETAEEISVSVDLVTIPEDEVRATVGTFNHDSGELSIPPNQQSWSLPFDCSWEEDVTILSIGPHMHAHGQRYLVERFVGPGQLTPVLQIDEWESGFRDAPPVLNFADGDMTVRAGDVFRTTCTWGNESDAPLTFPEEMCTTFGVAYPLEENAYCAGGDHELPDGPTGGG